MIPIGIVVLVLAQASEEAQIPRRHETRGAFLATAEGTYGRFCAHCHGDDGKGGGRLWPMDLSPRPSDLTATTLDEAALARFVSDGSAAAGRSAFCPPWGGTLSEVDRERLVRFLARLAGRSGASTTLAGAAGEPDREPFPWAWIGLLVVEVAVLGRVLVRARGPAPAREVSP